MWSMHTYLQYVGTNHVHTDGYYLQCISWKLKPTVLLDNIEPCEYNITAALSLLLTEMCH